ncbi:hypothetical protein [Subdoligranulum variabile]|uniref:Lipoprotein n=1 Tax=Subdoligranulum variabile DSM 15176 TaxID=411471 RepID=D1PLL0_9FIRM|nr:hypothetical protein [Subdoligranulum variabile]EFB76308.1 hypothetical protein SUBVAR_05225 [Subdoligranulum variabile DSM 15176]UWP67944.1 hypothetical protein NQ490_13545 [Subdoligranulum variabile]
MKRIFSLALVTLLLAGCAAAPASETSETTSTSATAETPAADTPTSGDAQSLRPLQLGDEKQYYMDEMVTGELIRYRVADLVNHVTEVPCNVEGCTHDSESCPAVFRRGECDRVFVLDDDTLVAFTNNQFPETEDSLVVLLDRNCQNRRVAATIPNSCFLSLGYGASDCPYTDGQYLYCSGYKSGYGEDDALFRIDTESGEVTDLLENAPVQDVQFLGALGTQFVFSQSDVTYPEPTGDLIADAQAAPTGTSTHWLFNPYTGEWKVFQTYTSDDGSLTRMYSIIVDGQYYQADRETGSISVVNPVTGEAKLLTDQYPTDQLQDSFTIQDTVQDWLIFYAPSPMVNLQTGEVREKPNLPDNYWNGSGHQPNIYLNLGDTLLVDCRYEPYTRTVLGTDGTPYTIDTEHEYLGLISAEDFLNGVPNYTEVGEYTT